MRDKILEFIKKRFNEETGQDKFHDSSCYYPWKNCSCKILNHISYDTPLIKSGIIDSFSMMVLFIFLEKTFEVKIPDKYLVLENFENIDKIVDLLNKIKTKI
jgi:acyl carrier protein